MSWFAFGAAVVSMSEAARRKDIRKAQMAACNRLAERQHELYWNALKDRVPFTPQMPRRPASGPVDCRNCGSGESTIRADGRRCCAYCRSDL